MTWNGLDMNINAIVIVETRKIPLRNIIKNHLQDGWQLVVFCGSNFDFVKEETKGLNAIIHKVGVDINEKYYNILLTSKAFWEALDYERVLIFQHDSGVLRKGIEEFLQWDYIGAPWKFQAHGGNGGLSIRNPKTMLEIISYTGYDQRVCGNEDVYFCNYMKALRRNLAPREVCEKFSVESIFKLGTWGYHAIEKHFSKQLCNQIKTQYVQVKT